MLRRISDLKADDWIVVDGRLVTDEPIGVIAAIQREHVRLRAMYIINGSSSELVRRVRQSRFDAAVTEADSAKILIQGLLQRRGLHPYCSQTARALFQAASDKAPARSEPRGAGLSGREVQVLYLLARGLTVRETGERLGLSPRTVDNHKTRMMRRLDVNSLAQLICLALNRGILCSDRARGSLPRRSHHTSDACNADTRSKPQLKDEIVSVD